MTGLYVHVPFCRALCPYCDFAVVVGKEGLHERYCDALVAEARARAWKFTASSVFVGGGTPTQIDARLLSDTLDHLEHIVPLADGAEVTIEANPDSVRVESLRFLRRSGVNRISIGAQSFSGHVLAALGRTHDGAAIARAVGAARAGGFANVSLDLIYGGPSETDDDWRASLAAARALEPDHLSCYALTIEERTAFGRAVARGRMCAPDEDVLARRYEIACEMLADLHHYEISNWAKPGYESRHNLVYWTQGDYLGIGIGAHSHRGGHRWWNTRSLGEYLTDPAGARAGEEYLDAAARAEEWLSLRLRLCDGVPIAEAERRLGRALDAPGLAEAGLATAGGGLLRLTRRGMLLENEVALRLLRNLAPACSV